MKTKKIFLVSLFIFVISFSPIAFTQAIQPPLPPVVNVYVSSSGYTTDTAIILEQFAHDAALCGIRLNITIMSYYDVIMSLFSGTYDMIMFITVAWYQPDSLDTIIWFLDYYFGDYNLWNYQNEEIKAQIQLLKDYYYNGEETEAINIFHEIEKIIFYEQSQITIGYHFDSYLIHTHQLIINSHPDRPCNDIAIRKALSFLIDREIYISAMQTRYVYPLFVSSHLFGWSQYHDNTLREVVHSIGKAASTLAQAGYRPRAIF